MARGTGSKRPTTSGAKPQPATNRILNGHPRIGPARSVGKGDVDTTFGVNIPIPSGNPIAQRSGTIATGKPRVATGSAPVRQNKYRGGSNND